MIMTILQPRDMAKLGFRIVISADPDQTEKGSLIWIYTVYLGMSVWIFMLLAAFDKLLNDASVVNFTTSF